MGMERGTPGYMVREEIQKTKLKARAGKKDWRFEERLAEKGESKIARRYLREINERGRKEVTWSKWEEQRRQVFEER